MNIEIFPCAGGMAEGFRRAGVAFDMAVEIMEDHCESYETNLGHRPLQMDARSLLSMLVDGWRPPRRVRLLVADPPCTPWSRSGKRLGTDDPRDMLEGTCRIIEHLRPDVYLIGNVPGLDDGPNLATVQRTIGALSKHGYCTADFARLDAVNYGVPQHRVRPFWFGHLDGPCIQWPRPTHCDPELAQNLTLATVDELIPWITCRQALSHLPMELLGRPIKIRKRNSNTKQHGSVPERPARVVGTSNLSDGNVLLPPEAPRAGHRGGRKRDRGRQGQGNRTGDFDKPSATVVTKPARKGAGASSTFTLQPRRGSDGGLGGLAHPDHPAPAILRNTHGNASVLVLNEKHAPSHADRPAKTIGSKDRGQSGVIVNTSKHPAVDVDAPATTIRGGGEGHSAPPIVLTSAPNHPASHADEPSMVIRGGSGGGATRAVEWPDVIASSSKHPPSPANGPAMTVRGSDGEGVNRVVEWPWDRPSVTIQADDRLPPPGHHDEDYGIMNLPGGVVISELAAAVLQGFPYTLRCACNATANRQANPWDVKIFVPPKQALDGIVKQMKDGKPFSMVLFDPCKDCGDPIEIFPWRFVGKTKKSRFSQIGQAMPPPLAHAVATSVVAQMRATGIWTALATGNLSNVDPRSVPPHPDTVKGDHA